MERTTWRMYGGPVDGSEEYTFEPPEDAPEAIDRAGYTYKRQRVKDGSVLYVVVTHPANRRGVTEARHRDMM